jgi:RNA polymerase sigma factor (sigma-70 family)
MRNDPTVVALVVSARDGDGEAWNQIVERYAPLVWSICQRYRLSRLDADDVGQNVWLSLFQHLRTIREPAALPGWIARTTGNECLRVLTLRTRQHNELAPDVESGVDGGYDLVEEELERAEQQMALRQAFGQLQRRCQTLLALLFHEARPPYAQISRQLRMKVGSIGPTRERCLAELRRTPAMADFIKTHRQSGNGGELRAWRMVDR